MRALVAEVRGALVNCAMGAESAERAIEDALDDAIVEQKINQGIFDLGAITEFVIDTMQRLCMPARDGDIEQLRRHDGTSAALMHNICNVLSKMSMDIANYRLHQLAPLLTENSVQYERDCAMLRLGLESAESVPKDRLVCGFGL